MSFSKDVDVLIIGAGPAGLASGIIFARNGLKTIVAEKKTLPVDKPCGEGIMPVGVQSLIELGASDYLAPGDFHSFYGVSYHLDGEKTAAGLFENGPGWGIRRTVLSNALLQSARQYPSLEIIEGVPASPLRFKDNKIEASIGKALFSSRLLVGADGRHSTVRKWAGLESPPLSPYRWGAVQHFSAAPWSRLVEVHWGKGVEAYITPVSSNEICLAFLWDRRRYKIVGTRDSLFRSFLNLFPVLKERLDRIEPSSPILAAGPLEQRSRDVISDGILLTGDAGGYLDALTGEGLSLALASARALEKNVVPIISDRGRRERAIRKEDLKTFAAAHKKIIEPHLHTTRLVLFLAQNPAILKLTVRTLAHKPTLFHHFLNANMGLAPVFPGLARLTRLLLANQRGPTNNPYSLRE